MASANVNPSASCGDGSMTDRGCTVSKQTDYDCVLHKVAHKNNTMPNGCLNHSLEDNGLVRLLEGSGESGLTIRENSIEDTVSNVADDSLSCECGHVSNAANDIAVNSVCANVNNNGDMNGTTDVVDSVTDSFQEEKIAEDLKKICLDEPSCPSKTSVLDNESSQDTDVTGGLEYVVYESELQMPDIMRLITKDLSEPYSIYTYRYFIHNWPRLCFLAMDKDRCVGAIVCKHDLHKKMVRRGYIAMLAVDQDYRRRGIGSHLVMKAIRAMVADECDEVVLETEITNKAALKLYENLGFLRDKRLFRYYLNGVDALRLKLWLR